jgi:hypothetical protein
MATYADQILMFYADLCTNEKKKIKNIRTSLVFYLSFVSLLFGEIGFMVFQRSSFENTYTAGLYCRCVDVGTSVSQKMSSTKQENKNGSPFELDLNSSASSDR